MKKIIILGFLLFVCAAGWEIGGRLSTDAIGLGLGVLFGVMAGVPAALIALAASRRHESYTQSGYDYHPIPYRAERGDSYHSNYHSNGRGHPVPQNYQPQPPVIIVAGMPGQYGQGQFGQGHYAQGNAAMQPMAQNGVAYLPGTYPQNAVIDGVARPVQEQSSGRQFRLVGEREQLIEEW